MLKSVVLCIILWHGMCKFSSHAHPGSTVSRILDFPARVSAKINDTNVQIEPRVIYNFNYFNNTQIFFTNGSSSGTITSTTVPKTASIKNSEQGYVVTNGIGAHKLHTKEHTWSEARKICIAEGGDLAVIRSAEEENIVQEMDKVARKVGPKRDGIGLWIGFRDPFGKGDWISVFGETLDENRWAHWSNSEVQYNGNKCVVFYPSSGAHGMCPIDCNAKRYFICKKTTI